MIKYRELPTLDANTIEKFWSFAKKSDGCWVFGNGIPEKYAQFYHIDQPFPAHRLAYMLTYGPFDSKWVVCHKCDNPPCVRPDHLFLGTQTDNLNDAASKGRISGVNSRLNAEQASEIRRIRKSTGMTYRALAKMFNISFSTVAQIVAGKIWKQNTPPE